MRQIINKTSNMYVFVSSNNASAMGALNKGVFENGILRFVTNNFKRMILALRTNRNSHND
jgi:hypothetical protein